MPYPAPGVRTPASVHGVPVPTLPGRLPAWLRSGPPAWVLLGVLVVVYTVGIALFALLAVLVHTARLLTSPLLGLLGRLAGRPRAAAD